MKPGDVTIEHIDHETERIVDTAASFRNDAVLAPSLCEGWSRGHVLSHVARNADALRRVCTAALTGSGDTMYAAVNVRDREIVAGARRSATRLAEDIRESGARLRPELAKIGPKLEGVTVERTPGGPRIPAEMVPFMRLRELVFHHIDLDAGFTFRHVSSEVVELFLGAAVGQLQDDAEAPSVTVRTDEGDVHVIGDGAAYVTGPRADVLLWLVRGRTDGVTCDGPLPTLPSMG